MMMPMALGSAGLYPVDPHGSLGCQNRGSRGCCRGKHRNQCEAFGASSLLHNFKRGPGSVPPLPIPPPGYSWLCACTCGRETPPSSTLGQAKSKGLSSEGHFQWRTIFLLCLQQTCPMQWHSSCRSKCLSQLSKASPAKRGLPCPQTTAPSHPDFPASGQDACKCCAQLMCTTLC